MRRAAHITGMGRTGMHIGFVAKARKKETTRKTSA
jgi:hypothetical protein